MICHKRRLVFVHIPKTAGSSVIETLFPELVGKWGSYRSHFLPEEHSARVWREYFTFCFIRNPWDRMVSLYHYWCDGKYLDLPRREMSFAEFGWNYRAVITYNGEPNIHVRPQVDFVERKGVRVKYCGRFESLQHDFDHICTCIGLPKTPLPWRIPSHHRRAGSYRKYYRGDRALIQHVAKEFAEDVRIGGYSF